MPVKYSPVLSVPVSQSGGPNHPIIGWHNIVTFGSLAATLEDPEYPVTNLANTNTSNVQTWIGAASGSEQMVTVTTNTADDLDYMGIVGHNFGSLGLGIYVEGSVNGVDWFELIPAFVPATDAPLLLRWDPQPLELVRLVIPPTATPPEAATMYVGLLLMLERKVFTGHGPITYNKQVRVTNGRSESGKFLGRIVTGEVFASGLSIVHVTEAFFRSDIAPFLDAAQEIPFFFAWRPFTYPMEVGFCWLQNSPTPSNQLAVGLMALELQLGGMA